MRRSESKGISEELPISIVAHLGSSFSETLKPAMVAHEVKASVDKSASTMMAHMPNTDNENVGISAVAHAVIGVREKSRERSLSVESDTFVGDLEDDIDDYVFYSSDEEWKYEEISFGCKKT